MGVPMDAQRFRRRLVVLATAAVALAACERPPSVVPTSAPTVVDADLPGPGTLHLTALPEQATVELVIRTIRDGAPSRDDDRIPAGAPVQVERVSGPGPRDGLEVNGVVCDGTYPIEEWMETDVVVTFDETGCKVAVLRVHAENEAVHGETTGNVYGWAGIGTVVRVRPIAGDGEERSMHADPDGSFRFFDLLAGTYVLTIERSGQPIETRRFELEALGEVYLELAQPPQ